MEKNTVFKSNRSQAGHARSLGLIVVTNNMREFTRVPGLRTEEWKVK